MQVKGKDRSSASEKSFVSKVFVRRKEWEQKEELLDIVYWMRQVIAVLLGLVWGIIPLHGIVGLILFFGVSFVMVYVYHAFFHQVDEEEFGGLWELAKEGMMTSFALFLITWIMTYTCLNFG